MKGIILAAGKGTRLYPMTLPTCKPLLPVYDKPLIYYPLAVLLEAGIRDILIIIPPGEEEIFRKLLGDGAGFGARISYRVQHEARGIADALIIGEAFAGDDRICLILGDNIFWSPGLKSQLLAAAAQETGATVFGRYVEDPRPFGVAEFDADGKVVGLEEKPAEPKSHYAVTGLYFYDKDAIPLAKTLKPSARGELEITDLNKLYMARDKLRITLLDKDVVWQDAGTADSVLGAAELIRDIQRDTGRYVGCIEEVAMRSGFITPDECRAIGARMAGTNYGRYLETVADET